MKQNSEKLVFGVSAKEQIADRLRKYIDAHFESGSTAAAALGISKQRLSLYTTGKAMPRASLIDKIARVWNLDLFGASSHPRQNIRPDKDAKTQLLLLFEKPVTFGDDELKVVVQRKGNSLVASISLSANLKVG